MWSKTFRIEKTVFKKKVCGKKCWDQKIWTKILDPIIKTPKKRVQEVWSKLGQL